MAGRRPRSGRSTEGDYFSTSALVSNCNITKDLLIHYCLGMYIVSGPMMRSLISCPVLQRSYSQYPHLGRSLR